MGNKNSPSESIIEDNVLVIGMSGSGKTTLLHYLRGFRGDIKYKENFCFTSEEIKFKNMNIIYSNIVYSPLKAMRLKALLVFFILICSCKKLVEVGPPLSQLVTESVFDDNTTATSAQTAIYSQMVDQLMAYNPSSAYKDRQAPCVLQQTYHRLQWLFAAIRWLHRTYGHPSFGSPGQNI